MCVNILPFSLKGEREWEQRGDVLDGCDFLGWNDFF